MKTALIKHLLVNGTKNRILAKLLFVIAILISVSSAIHIGRGAVKENPELIPMFWISTAVCVLVYLTPVAKTRILKSASPKLIKELTHEIALEDTATRKRLSSYNTKNYPVEPDTTKSDMEAEAAKEELKAVVKYGNKQSGKVVLEEWFMLNYVRLYENGYIFLTLRGMKGPEKLVAISGNTSVMTANSEKHGSNWGGAILTVITEKGPYQVKATTNNDDTYYTPEKVATLEKIVLYAQTLIDANKTKKRPRQESNLRPRD